MKDLKNSTKIIIAIIFFIAVIIYAVIFHYDEPKSLHNGIIVTGKVTNLLMARGGLVVYVEYNYHGHKYDSDFLTNDVSSINKNDLIFIKISTKPVGKYIDFIKKIN